MNSERVELGAVTSESCINGVVIVLHREGNAEFERGANITEDNGQQAKEGSCLFWRPDSVL